jgi:xylulokinase
MDKVVLAIDHGTSGIKAALVTVHGEVLDTAFAPTPVRFVPGGGAEQDPSDWWNALVLAARELLGRAKVRKNDVVAIGVSSTFSTTVAVGADGRHLMPALTWMDSRGAPYIKALMGGFPAVQGYGVANLLRWVPKTSGGPTLSGKDDIAHALLVKHDFPAVYGATRAFLPSKDYLNLRLCGETAATHDSIQLFWVTDIRDASHIRYDDGLIARAGLDRSKLPPLVRSTHILGTLTRAAAEELGLPASVQVVAGSADHQSALIGSGAVRDFEPHLYLGTSSWVQCVVPFKKTDVLHSIASLPAAIPGRYQSVNEQDIAGGCLGYIADRLFERGAGPEVYREMDVMAARAPAGSSGLMFAPWLNGERTPVDDHRLRGALFNLGMTTTRDEVVRAVFEGVALNTRWSLRYVERFCGRTLDPIAMVGGGATSDVWCQIFADVLRRTVKRVKDPLSANARGAALIAAVGLGELSFGELPGLVTIDGVFAPSPGNGEVYERRFDEFLRLYRASRGLFHRINR